jgi:hypothetical protein
MYVPKKIPFRKARDQGKNSFLQLNAPRLQEHILGISCLLLGLCFFKDKNLNK